MSGASRRRPARGGGAEGNERLTSIVGLTLVPLLAVEAATTLSLSSYLNVHIFLGLLLLPAISLKLASTAWRALRYYSGSGPYRSLGPPLLAMRLLVAAARRRDPGAFRQRRGFPHHRRSRRNAAHHPCCQLRRLGRTDDRASALLRSPCFSAWSRRLESSVGLARRRNPSPFAPGRSRCPWRHPRPGDLSDPGGLACTLNK